MLDDLIEFSLRYGALIAGLSLFTLLLSLLLTLAVIRKLPSDYWLTRFETRATINYASPVFYLRNLTAVFLLLIGFILLFMPGQGLLTILVAIIISESPFKNAMVRRLIDNKNVQQGLNGMRAWMKKDKFSFPQAKNR